MPREIVTLHVGQAGNQIGTEFWRTVCREHAIGNDGTLHATQSACAEGPDCRDVVFREDGAGRFMPRALLLDLEPRVINSIQTGDQRELFNPENVFLSSHGGGAGNNWASGYDQGEQNAEELAELIEREARDCDSLQGFVLTHSIAGGTGSGLGSYLLEALSDAFPKTMIHTYSVFPNWTNEASDVVVQPYNSLLTLKRLALDADAVVVLDNTALDAILQQQLGIEQPSVAQGNSLVSTVMAAATAPARFPGLIDMDMAGMASSLAASPRAHLLSAAYSPLAAAARHSAASGAAGTSAMPGGAAGVRSTSVQDVMRRLLQRKNAMVRPPGPSAALREARYIAAVDILQGDVDMAEVHRTHSRMRERGDLPFHDRWPASLQVVPARASPHLQHPHRVNGLMLANHTAVRHTLDKNIAQYDTLMHKKAYLQQYGRFPMFQSGKGKAQDLTEFEEAREVIASLSAEYAAFEQPGGEMDDGTSSMGGTPAAGTQLEDLRVAAY